MKKAKSVKPKQPGNRSLKVNDDELPATSAALVRELLSDFVNLRKRKISIAEMRARARTAEVIVEIKRMELITAKSTGVALVSVPLIGPSENFIAKVSDDGSSGIDQD